MAQQRKRTDSGEEGSEELLAVAASNERLFKLGERMKQDALSNEEASRLTRYVPIHPPPRATLSLII